MQTRCKEIWHNFFFNYPITAVEFLPEYDPDDSSLDNMLYSKDIKQSSSQQYNESLDFYINYLADQDIIHFCRFTDTSYLRKYSAGLNIFYIFYVEKLNIYIKINISKEYDEKISSLLNNIWFLMQADNGIDSSIPIRTYYGINNNVVDRCIFKEVPETEEMVELKKDFFGIENSVWCEFLIDNKHVLYLPTSKLKPISEKLNFDAAVLFYNMLEKNNLLKYLEE